MNNSDLIKRLERIEAYQAIQQLACRYALAVDSRDLDTWVGLFIEDVNCGRLGKGRDVLRGIIGPNIRGFYRSMHQICGHVIDFDDNDSERATGKVYCRAEHEDGKQWIVMAICYFDEYQHREGHWYFVRRREKHWYSTDILARPEGPNFQRWDKWPDVKPTLPQDFPTWTPFWENMAPAERSKLTAEP